jgi:hypothetical protein
MYEDKWSAVGWGVGFIEVSGIGLAIAKDFTVMAPAISVPDGR